MRLSQVTKAAVVLLFLISTKGIAQCAMCRAAIETEGDSSKAEALNDGIVYLMIMPYLLAGLIGFIIYRMRKNRQV
jgi:hypothetical protein